MTALQRMKLLFKKCEWSYDSVAIAMGMKPHDFRNAIHRRKTFRPQFLMALIKAIEADAPYDRVKTTQLLFEWLIDGSMESLVCLLECRLVTTPVQVTFDETIIAEEVGWLRSVHYGLSFDRFAALLGVQATKLRYTELGITQWSESLFLALLELCDPDDRGLFALTYLFGPEDYRPALRQCFKNPRKRARTCVTKAA